LKISCSGLGFEEGKIKYADERLEALKEKFNPKKYSPFYFEIIKEKFDKADIIALAEENILDLLILDIDKCERRILNSEDEFEKKLMEKALKNLEEEAPLCDVDFNEDEKELLRAVSMLSIKPVILFIENPTETELIQKALKKSKQMFFYTAGPSEVHAWFIKKGATILECAAKIHSDLARGFVKGDVVAFGDFMESHNFNDARSKGLVKLVDRDYIVSDGDVIEIRSGI
jgi:ribosome-binding ATPase YchF (GTP1/OBG family)